MASVSFTIRGKPCAKARARTVTKFSKEGKRQTWTYDPNQEQKDDAVLIIQQNAPANLLDGPLKVYIRAYLPIPKSTSKKRRMMMTTREILPTKKPDADNVYHFYTDCMKGIIYHDDSQIVSETVDKFYSETPRVDVEVMEIQDASPA